MYSTCTIKDNIAGSYSNQSTVKIKSQQIIWGAWKNAKCKELPNAAKTNRYGR